MKRQNLIPWLVIAAGLLAYQNSFTGPFIFDDTFSIKENPTIRRLWPIWQPLLPPHRGGITVEGRPIINLSLAINYALGGYNVWGYHALNLTVHILAGLTLLGIVRRTMLQPRLRVRFGAAANGLALAAAVLWTVHPLQTESVTYIIQRAESIMGLFYLLTLYCFIRGAESGRSRLWYGLSVTACAVGMASKEVMVSAPLMVLLYDRTFVSASYREAWRRHWSLYLALASTWVLLGFLLMFGQLPVTSANAQRVGFTWWAYLLTEPGVILHYLRISVWPYPLCLDYGWPIAHSWPTILPATVAVVLLLGASAWAWRTNQAWGFLGAWFLFILAPSSSFVPLESPAFEHRMYLPLAAVVVLGVIGVHALAGRRSAVVVAALAVGLGFLTWRRNQDYRSEFTIWADTVAKRPKNPRAQCSLGDALSREGRVQEAIASYERALRLKPDYAEAHNNLGTLLARAGKVEEAIGHFEQALRIRPDYPEADNNLGAALVRLGKVQEAIGHYERVVRTRPDSAEAHNNLGNALAQVGKVPEAIGQYEQALRLWPNYAEAANNLAWLLATLAPAEGGDPGRAESLARQACEMTGNRAAAYLDTLAAAYAAAGHFAEAVATARTARELALSAGQQQLAGEIETRLEFYRSGRAYHQSADTIRAPKPR